jgi:hypothetical protein
VQQEVHVEHMAQEDVCDRPWQVVRRRRWWHQDKRCRIRSNLHVGKQWRVNRFKELVGARWFNCLALDHIRANCRDPVKCWWCKHSRHSSNVCGFLKADCSGSGLPSPKQITHKQSIAPLHSFPSKSLLSSASRLQHPSFSIFASMRRRRSFNSASADPRQ